MIQSEFEEEQLVEAAEVIVSTFTLSIDSIPKNTSDMRNLIMERLGPELKGEDTIIKKSSLDGEQPNEEGLKVIDGFF